MGELAWRTFRRDNVFIPEYFWKRLSQSDAVTTYMELNKQLKNCLHPKICCPEVVSVTLYVFPGCKNIACGRPVVVIPDEPSTSCQQCNTTMKVSKCSCIFHCTSTFEDMEKPLNLPPEALQSYLRQDVRFPPFHWESRLFLQYQKRNNTYEKTLADTIFFSNLYL